MARNLDAYSKAVSWLKLVLPIVGLGILSTLFLVAREARIERGELTDEFAAPDRAVETARSPNYAGVTGDGSAVTVTAGMAWPKPDGSGRFEASEVRARFDMPNGETADIRAETGELGPAGSALALSGNVVVETGSGWTVESETLDALLDWTRLTSPSAVRAEGPIGTLDAGNMLIHRDKAAGAAYLMEFNGGVHLVYRP